MSIANSQRAMSVTGPARAIRTITPDDNADLPDGIARGLYVGVAGVVRLHDAEGVSVTLISADCQYHPIQVSRVLADGSTADGMLALY